MEEGGGCNGRPKDIKLKGKVLMSCVMPAYLYGLETVVLTETATKAAGLRVLGQEDCRSEEGGYKEDG